MTDKIDFIIQCSRRKGRIRDELVLCDLCDNPASREFSLALSWTACGPCATGEAATLDPDDFIFAGEAKPDGA